MKQERPTEILSVLVQSYEGQNQGGDMQRCPIQNAANKVTGCGCHCCYFELYLFVPKIHIHLVSPPAIIILQILLCCTCRNNVKLKTKQKVKKVHFVSTIHVVTRDATEIRLI